MSQEDLPRYKVVVTLAEQCSFWSLDQESPPGWKVMGTSGLQEDRLAYIKPVWTDMMPLCLRQRRQGYLSELLTWNVDAIASLQYRTRGAVDD